MTRNATRCQHRETRRSETHRSEAVQRRKKTKLSIAAFADPWLPCRAMGSTARKLQTNQREKPRDLSRCLGERTIEYCETFVPGIVDDPAGFARRIFVQMPDGSWLPCDHITEQANVAPIDPLQAVRAHVEGGQTRTLQWIPGLGLPFTVGAIGIQFNATDVVGYANIDLDGGTKGPAPSEIIAKIRTLGACPLITAGSGKPGKYRVLIRLKRPCTIRELKSLVRETFAGVDLRLMPGSIEVFPSQTNGRMPLGFLGCVRFYDDDLKRKRPFPFDEMLLHFKLLPAFDLDDAHARFAPVPSIEEKWDDETNQTKAQKAPKCSKRTQAPTPLETQRWRAQGAGPDERLRAIAALIRDDWFLGLSQDLTEDDLCQWVRHGGITRTNFAKRYKGKAIARQIADIPRQVANIWRLLDTMPRPTRARVANLSAREILALVPMVERAARRARTTVKRAGSFALAMLPKWKGTEARTRTESGVRVHRDTWRDAAGDRGDYARLREAFDLWEPVSGYLPKQHAAGKAPYSTAWTCSFAFDDEQPSRAPGRTWDKAVKFALGRAKIQNQNK